MSLTPKSKKTKRRASNKPKRLTKAQVKEKLLKFVGSGWTSKMVDDAKEFQWAGQSYPVTLADKYAILHEYRKQLVEPLIDGRFKLPKIDRDSFIQQEEAYDGEMTDIAYIYKIPKIAQEWIKKHDGNYLQYIETIYGREFAAKYHQAENKALEKTFGRKGLRAPDSFYEEEEWNEGIYYKKVLNEWHPDIDELVW